MNYLTLFFVFLKIGLFSFGGAYGALALIQEEVLRHGWADEAMFANIAAISEATPGPIMVNMATYIGSRQGGFFGALLATVGVILPAFVILLLIVSLLRHFLQKEPVQAALRGIKPCLMGVILATGCLMAVNAVREKTAQSVDYVAICLLLGLGALSFGWKKLFKKQLPPIALIGIAALCGICFYR